VIVQFGGQTPLKLARALEAADVPILGTSPDAIDLAEDRDRFKRVLDKLRLKQPKNGIAYSVRAGAAGGRRSRAAAGGASILCAWRPRDADHPRGNPAQRLSARHLAGAGCRVTSRARYPNDKTGQINTVLGTNPLLFDPLSVRRHRDRRRLPVRRQGHLHRRHHGAHRGSRHSLRRFRLLAAARIPLDAQMISELERQTRELALGLDVVGLMNVQYAIKNGDIYVLEVNPRASRTVPFVAKVMGMPVAKIAARIMAGEKLADFNLKKRKLGMSGSRSRYSRSPASPASIPCSVRRCDRPAR